MSHTYQTPTQTVLQHGESVWEYYQKIIGTLNGDIEYRDMQIPQSFLENCSELLRNQYSEDIVHDYSKYHDCGKPYCLEVDSDGKQHFPNHAEISAQTFRKYFPDHPHLGTVERLIRSDMDIHLLKDDGISEFCKKSIKDICTQLIVGLAEIQSNCMMFGGPESLGFKIKYKTLEQRSKKIFKIIEKNLDY